MAVWISIFYIFIILYVLCIYYVLWDFTVSYPTGDVTFPYIYTIIQHIDTLPKYGHITLKVHRSTWRISSDACKFGILKGSAWMTAACNFISLGEKMRELLDKNGKRKKKRKEDNYWSHDWEKNGRNLHVVSQCFLAKLNESWQNWFKVSTLDALWMKKHNFRKISIIITSGTWYKLDTS